MANIKDYSTTPASNTTLFPEGMARNQVNNSSRQVQSDVRGAFEDLPWFEFASTITWISGTQFRVVGDITNIIAVNDRMRAIGSLTGTIYGSASAVSYSSPNTTVTVVWDSGAMSNETLNIFVSKFSELNAIGTAILNSLIQTGDIKPTIAIVAQTGWLFCNGQSMGSVASNATQASDDNEALFTLIWNNVANTESTILDSSGAASTRGASAAADWAANKRLKLPDFRERVLVGGHMGGGDPSRIDATLTGLDTDILLEVGGSDGEALSVAQMAAHFHKNGVAHKTNVNPHIYGFTTDAGAGSATDAHDSGFSAPAATTRQGDTQTVGSGDEHNNVQPSIVVNYLIKK